MWYKLVSNCINSISINMKLKLLNTKICLLNKYNLFYKVFKKLSLKLLFNLNSFNKPMRLCIIDTIKNSNITILKI